MADRNMEKHIYPSGEANFLLDICFQQNANRQGTIAWVEGRKSKSFKNTIDIVMFIEEAIKRSNNYKKPITNSKYKNLSIK